MLREESSRHVALKPLFHLSSLLACRAQSFSSALKTAKKEKPQHGSCQKTAAFSPESFKCTGDLQQLLQGEAPSQAVKWVMQAKSLWSTQHSAQSLKSCRKLEGGHQGTVNQPGTACSRALQCGWGYAGTAAWPGTHRPRAPPASPTEQPKSKPCFEIPAESPTGRRNLPGDPMNRRSQVAFGNRQAHS